MAKISIVGDAAVVTSTLSVEDIKTLKKYRPEALTLMGGEDGKEPVFAVELADGCGSISKYGITFSGATRDGEKKATLTLILKNVTGDVREYVADMYGSALAHLNEMESILPGVLADVNERKQNILESITVSA